MVRTKAQALETVPWWAGNAQLTIVNCCSTYSCFLSPQP